MSSCKGIPGTLHSAVENPRVELLGSRLAWCRIAVGAHGVRPFSRHLFAAGRTPCAPTGGIDQTGHCSIVSAASQNIHS
jgi:hypothetical protein